ncbi:putative uncharacterized protein CIMIP3 [Erythrolamprus reginae]|uniref:putative uncharacterized protein CIMIP3 n=1 Tax=Erythrolamprus reginae TaxID=121349 RepID=UPI00396C3FE9
MKTRSKVKPGRMAQEKKGAAALPKSSDPAGKPQKKHPVILGYKMEQALVSEYVPVVIHSGGFKPEHLSFAFYNPNYSNCYNPFYTLQKPTCGYRYCRDTDHRRKVLDIERVNIPKWRTIVQKKPGLAPEGSKV